MPWRGMGRSNMNENPIGRLNAMRVAASWSMAERHAHKYLDYVDNNPSFQIPVELECKAFDNLNALADKELIQ